MKLFGNVTQMHLDRRLSDRKDSGDLLVAQPLTEQPEDLKLAARQELLDSARTRLASQEIFERLRSGPPLQPALAGVDLTDAGEQRAQRHFLEKKATSAELDGLLQDLLVLRFGEEDDPGGRALLGQFPEHRGTVQDGHPRVQNQDVRRVPADGLERFPPIGTKSDDL